MNDAAVPQGDGGQPIDYMRLTEAVAAGMREAMGSQQGDPSRDERIDQALRDIRDVLDRFESLLEAIADGVSSGGSP